MLYNDTGCDMTDEVIKGICDIMIDYPEGIATSKIAEGFYEYAKCHLVISAWMMYAHLSQCRFIKNDALSSVLIAYVRMKDNWHGSIERYMLNEDDLSNFQAVIQRA